MLLPLLLNLSMFDIFAAGGISGEGELGKPRRKTQVRSNWAEDVSNRHEELIARDPTRVLSRSERKKQEKLRARGVVVTGDSPSVQYAPELAKLEAPRFDDVELNMKQKTVDDGTDELMVLLMSEA